MLIIADVYVKPAVTPFVWDSDSMAFRTKYSHYSIIMCVCFLVSMGGGARCLRSLRWLVREQGVCGDDEQLGTYENA